MESTQNDTIFNALKDVIAEPDFRTCQMDYMEKNCDKIRISTDDLGQAYVGLWAEYTQAVLDGYVDKQMTAHSQDDQNAFYKNYVANIGHYKTIDEDTCEVLAGFIDIKVFANLMKEVKQSLGLTDQKEDASMSVFLDPTSEEGVKKLMLEDFTDKKLGWSKVTKAEKLDMKMEVYKRPMEGSPVVLFGSNQQIKGFKIATLNRYCSKFMDTVKGNDEIKAFEMLQDDTANGHIICYFRFGMGFMDDRDMICDFTYKMREETNDFIMVIRSIDDLAKYPIKKDEKGKDVIRFSMVKASLAKDTDYGYECKEVFNMNMGGNFPHRLLNMVMGSSLAKEIPQLHKDLTYHAAEAAKE